MHLVMTIGTCRHLIIQAWLKDAVCIIFCGPMLPRLLVAVVLCPLWRSRSYFRCILALGGRGGLAYPPDLLFLFPFLWWLLPRSESRLHSQHASGM